MVTPIKLEDLCAEIKTNAGCQCEVYDGVHGDHTLSITPDQLKPVIDVIFKTFDYCHLSAITVQQRTLEKAFANKFVPGHPWFVGLLGLYTIKHPHAWETPG